MAQTKVSHISVKAQRPFPAAFPHATKAQVGLVLFFMNKNLVQITLAAITQAQVAMPDASPLTLLARQRSFALSGGIWSISISPTTKQPQSSVSYPVRRMSSSPDGTGT